MQSGHHAVFISYSWDDDDHVDRVLGLAHWLRANGVDAWVDKFDSPSEPWPLWCYHQVEAAEVVLVVCTETYRRRVMREEAEGTGRGATLEGAVITNAVYAATHGQTKFIPVVFSTHDVQHVPFFLDGYSVYDLSDEDGRTDLYARLTGQRRIKATELGPIRVIDAEISGTAWPVGHDVGAPPQQRRPQTGPAGPTQRSATAVHPTESLRHLLEGDWVVDVVNPMVGRSTMELKITRSVLGKRRFEATILGGGVPGWRSSGEWEVLPPGDRVTFHGTQMLGPYQAAPLQEIFTFDGVGHDELTGVNAAGMPVSWHRR